MENTTEGCVETMSRQRKWYYENRDRAIKKSREYKERNEAELKVKRKSYYIQNKEKFSEAHSKWYEENKQYALNHNVKYREENAEHIAEYNKEYQKTHRAEINAKRKFNRETNARARLVENLRCRIYMGLCRAGYKKTSRTCEVLGADYDTVRKHLEGKFTNGMCWELMGKKIHIDHIIPLASATTKEELLKLCHYTNLQPLWAEDNLKKSTKILIT
jgi:FKBP-type peptidyl-prolyl cis-trans isomerase